MPLLACGQHSNCPHLVLFIPIMPPSRYCALLRFASLGALRQQSAVSIGSSHQVQWARGRGHDWATGIGYIACAGVLGVLCAPAPSSSQGASRPVLAGRCPLVLPSCVRCPLPLSAHIHCSLAHRRRQSRPAPAVIHGARPIALAIRPRPEFNCC
ncbi:hypothetical protein K458DRAFT_414341 [Lentithecium fluviatile CBS 122367]|uniref:Uncharacterized protein n=1 Tax=Lentithecium fluviatile CBS 122367 TaxID=1168545 RepID=A0A6G1JEP9_9PLEO|nr:hypothetical protein K458DRAFT_414341 [Lentithecium fluviatile CBS 122367]